MEIQNYTKLFANGKGLWIVIVLGIVLLLLPNLLRDSSYAIGNEGYYHLDIAKDVVEGKSYELLGWSYLIAKVSDFGLTLEASANVLLLLLGVLFILLFYLILKDIIKERVLALLVLIFSPAFIYLFSVSNRFAVPMVLGLLCCYLLLKKKFVLSVLSFLLVLCFDVGVGLLLLLLVLFYYLHLHKKRLIMIVLTLLLFLGLLIYGGLDLNILSDLGVLNGVGVFALLIALLGVIQIKNRERFVFGYLMGIILILLSFKFNWIIFSFNIVLSLLVVFGLVEIFNMRWESKLVKNLTFLILVVGVVFSGVSHVNTLSNSEPYDSLFEALDKIPEGSKILSVERNKNWIDYSGKEGVIGEDIFFFRDRSEVVGLLNEYDIKYILIDEKMRDELWEGKEEGLLWLLKYNEGFEEQYSTEELVIWEYTGE